MYGKASGVVLALALAVVMVDRGEAIDCYNCTGDMTTANGRACADVQGILTVSGFTGACYTETSISRPDNRPIITRGGIDAPTPVTPTCEHNIARGGASCSCTTNQCNNKPVKVPTLSCYECSTMGLIDNGCGNGAFMSGSLYVKKTPGCHACLKTIGQDGAVIRACSRQLFTTNSCDDSNRLTTCYCTGDLCNSSPHHPAALPSLAASFFLVLFTRWLL